MYRRRRESKDLNPRTFNTILPPSEYQDNNDKTNSECHNSLREIYTAWCDCNISRPTTKKVSLFCCQ